MELLEPTMISVLTRVDFVAGFIRPVLITAVTSIALKLAHDTWFTHR
jgi:hypothetical protein